MDFTSILSISSLIFLFDMKTATLQYNRKALCAPTHVHGRKLRVDTPLSSKHWIQDHRIIFKYFITVILFHWFDTLEYSIDFELRSTPWS